MAPARVLLVSAANGAAVLWFIVGGRRALAGDAGDARGQHRGRLSGRAADAVPAGAVVRGFVVVLTATVTIAFFVRAM